MTTPSATQRPWLSPPTDSYQGALAIERRTLTGNKGFCLLKYLDTIAKFLNSYRDNLAENLGKTTAKIEKSTLPVSLLHSRF